MRSRRLSKSFIVFSGFAVLLFFLYLYLGLLPGDLKAQAIAKIEPLIGKKITFEKAIYLPFRGLTLYDPRFYEPDGSLIFSAKRLSVNVRLLPFLQDKKVIVNSIRIASPVYEVILKPRRIVVAPPPPKTKISGQIDVPVVPEHPEPKLSDIEHGPDTFLPENVYLEEIQISDGTVTVRQDPGGPVLEVLRDINIRMGFRRPPILRFEGSLSLGQPRYASISLKGKWDLEKALYEFELETKTSRIPAWLLEYQKKHFLILRDANILLSTHLRSLNESQILFHSKADLRQALIYVNKGSYAGHMLLDAQGLFDLDARRFVRYKGVLDLDNVDVMNLSKDIPRLDDLSGRVGFQPDQLIFSGMKGHYRKVPFEANGSIRSFKDLLLKILITSDSGIGELLSLIPAEQKKFLRGFEVEGDCHALTTISGSLRKPADLNKEYKLVISDGSLRNPAKKMNLTGISAEAVSDRTGLTLRNCRFTSSKIPYRLDLYIAKDPRTPGRIELRSEGFKVWGRYFPRANDILIREGTAEWAGASAKFGGVITGLERPYLNIQGTTALDLTNLPAPVRTQMTALKDAGLKGKLKGLFSLKGAWNDPMGWELGVDGSAAVLYIKQKFRLEDLKFQIRKTKHILNIPFFQTRTYGGTVGGNVALDLSRAGTGFNGKFYANHLNLASVMRDLSPKSTVTGLLNGQVALSGALTKQDTYRGTGNVVISQGNLWKTDLFKKMGELPFVRVEGLANVVFTDLSANIDIHDKRVWTEDLRLKSETVDLSLYGSVGFDSTLDMTMNIRYSSAIIDGAFDTGGLVPFVVQQAEDMISEYKISGTLQKPVSEKMAFPAGRVVGKKITGLVQAITT